jgi:hypothetical protein
MQSGLWVRLALGYLCSIVVWRQRTRMIRRNRVLWLKAVRALLQLALLFPCCAVFLFYLPWTTLLLSSNPHLLVSLVSGVTLFLRVRVLEDSIDQPEEDSPQASPHFVPVSLALFESALTRYRTSCPRVSSEWPLFRRLWVSFVT